VSKASVAVFVGNKLISTDTILPLMMELSRRGQVSTIRFLCVDWATYNVLQQNFVIRDAIDAIGELTFIGARKKTAIGRIWHRLAVLPLMAGLAIRAVLGQLTIVHFGIVNLPPFRWLYRLNRGATFYVQGTSMGYQASERRFDDIKQERARTKTTIAATSLIGFQADWPVLEQPETRRLPRVILGPTQLAPAWRDFVAARADRYFMAEYSRAGHEPAEDVLVFILGYLGQLDFIRDGTSMVALFEETLDALIERGEGRPIFIKPHAITDMSLLEKPIAARAGTPIIVSYLHPAVLATRARLFVANYYSGALSAAGLLGVPTIEYTDYSDSALGVTGDRSVRDDQVDHFILRDAPDLRAVIDASLAKPITNRRPNWQAVDEELLSALAGRKVPNGSPRQQSPRSRRSVG